MKHIFPSKRTRPVPLDLPKISTSEDAAKASNAALEAAKAGDITLEHAQKYIDIIDAHARILGYSVLEARIQAIENRIQSRDSEEL